MTKRVLGVSAFAILVLAFALCLTACSTADDTFTLSGTLIESNTSYAPDGCYAYGMLVSGPGGSVNSTPLYIAKSTAFIGGVATYSIPDIKKGTYTAYVYIDKNGSGGSLPNSGEKYAYDDITIGSDMTMNVGTSDWITY
jgi:hypothetical protein